MNLISIWWNTRKRRAVQKKFDQAVKLVESTGLTVCEISSVAGSDYIKGSDGSWHRIGGKSK